MNKKSIRDIDVNGKKFLFVWTLTYQWMKTKTSQMINVFVLHYLL